MKRDPWTLMCMQFAYLATKRPHPRYPAIHRGRVFMNGKWVEMEVSW